MMSDYKISSGEEAEERYAVFQKPGIIRSYPLRMNGESTIEIPCGAGYFRMGYDRICFYSEKCGNCRKIPERAAYVKVRTRTRSKIEREKRFIFS